jgi:hypothetical protein
LVQLTCLPQRIPPTHNGCADDHGQANFYEYLPTVEPLHWRIFQIGIGEKAMPEKRNRSEIDGEVHRLPKPPT